MREDGGWTIDLDYQTNLAVDDEAAGGPEGAIDSYVLRPNYPNPFNPRTMLEYILPGPAEVTIDVYNVNGERLVRLVQEHQDSGEHRVEWEAGDRPSGVYFVRMYADGPSGDFEAVRKMILVR